MFSGLTLHIRRVPVLGLALLILAGNASAEPYIAVLKGLQCSACHSQQTGGGKRNAYGNAYAQTELPAQRIGEGEPWLGELNKWLSVGADLRAGYQYVDTPDTPETSEFAVNRGAVYLEAQLIQNRLSLYLDQQVAPGASLNREAFVKLVSKSNELQVIAGQFYIPYGLRLQDDSAFVRQATGVNFTNPDRGIQFGYQTGQWSSQLALTNGSGGGSETDTGKQTSLLTSYVQPMWRAGFSLNFNDDDLGDRTMGGVFVGLKTGPLAWLAEVDLITDDLPGGLKQEATAGLIEANWQVRQGHNLKASYDYLDPDDSIADDRRSRYSLVWEYTPMQFLQGRFGARLYDGIEQVKSQNRTELFAEIHGFL